MKYLEFKQHLREYCKEFGVKFPDINQRHKLYKAYKDSLWEGVVDCNYTLINFLATSNWTKIFEGKMPSYETTSGERVEYSSWSKKKAKMKSDCDFSQPFDLAPLPKAVPLPWGKEFYPCVESSKQEGKTPMRYNDNYASASVNTVAVRSDVSIQRDYLADRLQSAFYPKQRELEKLFNLYVDNTPPTYKQLVEAIKNDKFKIDAKIAKRMELDAEDNDGAYYGPLHGIIFDGPQRDSEGFALAYEEMKKQKTTAQDVIVTSDAENGLKALQDFEAWLPTPATTTQ